MTESTQKIWSYVGRFTVVHIITYTLIATIFLVIQDALPDPTRVALETFAPYRSIGLIATSGQVLRSIVLALVLYPFYDTIVRSERGLLILFGALWGISVLGSVEPMPGSIEGVIYTETPLLTHLVVLAANAVEMFAFSWVFLRWERQNSVKMSHAKTEEVLRHG